MSDAVTSFWKSTNAFGPLPGPIPLAIFHAASGRQLCFGVSRTGASISAEILNPAAVAALAPARAPSRNAAPSSKLPLHAPALNEASCVVDGLKHSVRSSHPSLPRACECRCTAGDRPPDMATRSQSMCTASPVIWVAPSSTGDISTRATRCLPFASVTACPAMIWIPASLAALISGPDAPMRRSAKTTFAPAPCRLSAVR